MARETMQIQLAGLPWFAEDDYESFRHALPDRSWHASYRDWLSAAEQTHQRINESGVRAVKVHVQSDAFVAWCRALGLRVNTDALLRFANEYAIRVYSHPHVH